LSLSRRDQLILDLSILPEEERNAYLDSLSSEDYYTALKDPSAWDYILRPEQLRPVLEKDWRVFLIHAGRGFGKGPMGNYWLSNRIAKAAPNERVAIVAQNLASANDNILYNVDHGLFTSFAGYLPEVVTSDTRNGKYTFANGVQLFVYSSEAPDNIRGKNLVAFLIDEFFFFHNAPYILDNVIAHTVRKSKKPQILITSTPNSRVYGKYARELIARPGIRIQGGSAFDNTHLSPDYLESYRRENYTRFEREELFGELLTDSGGVFNLDDVNKHRLNGLDPLEFSKTLDRIILTLDAAGSAHSYAGIIVAGLKRRVDEQGKPLEPLVYVLADCTVPGIPALWANAVKKAVEKYGVHQVIVENNHGGSMIKHTLLQVSPNLPIKEINAQKSKEARAYPVANLYSSGRVVHVGNFQLLEDQMLEFDPEHNRNSPDRVDALVHAVTELAVSAKSAPPKPFNMPQMWF
jgi:phage terminase large subunit-like protein